MMKNVGKTVPAVSTGCQEGNLNGRMIELKINNVNKKFIQYFFSPLLLKI
jgi:hypothetical protein